LTYKLGGSIEFGHLALSQNDNLVAVQDGVDAMCNRDNCPILKYAASKSSLKERIRLNIDSSLFVPQSV
jgi:hypothetical protein